MSTLFDESQADKAIIATLLKTNRTLWLELEEKRKLVIVIEDQINRGKLRTMSKLLKDENGVLHVVEEAQVVTMETAAKLLGHFEHEVELLREFLISHTPAQTTETHPEAPVETPVVPVDDPAAPAEPTPPAPVESVPAAPEVPQTPVEQAPIAPQIDPATGLPVAPVQPTPAPIVEPQPLQ